MSDDNNDELPATTETPDAPVDNSKADKEDQVRSEMGAVFEAMQARAETAAQIDSPPPLPGKPSIDQVFEHVGEWMEKSPEARRTDSAAAAEVSRLQERARALGFELTPEKALEVALSLEAQRGGKAAPEYEAVVKQSYPDMEPQQVINQWNQIDAEFRRAPVDTGFRLMEQQTGLSRFELLRQEAARHAPQELQAGFVERDINTFFRLVPDAEKYQDQMLAAIESGKAKNTGDPFETLQLALDLARKSGSQSKRPRKSGARDFTGEMAATFDRVNSK